MSKLWHDARRRRRLQGDDNTSTFSSKTAELKIAADDILIFYIYISKKIRLDFSYESSA